MENKDQQLKATFTIGYAISENGEFIDTILMPDMIATAVKFFNDNDGWSDINDFTNDKSCGILINKLLYPVTINERSYNYSIKLQPSFKPEDKPTSVADAVGPDSSIPTPKRGRPKKTDDDIDMKDIPF